MGQMTAISRSERFMREFNVRACEIYKIHAPCITDYGLGFDDVYNVVRMYFNIHPTSGDADVVLQLDTVFYDPSWPDDDLVTSVASVLHLDEEVVWERLARAQLLGTPPCA